MNGLKIYTELNRMGTRTRTRRVRNKKTRRNKRRQYGKGASNWIEPITAAVQNAFPTFQRVITSDKSVVSIDIFCPNENIRNDTASIMLEMNKDELYVSGIASCTDSSLDPSKMMSGTNILKGIIAIGKELKPLGIARIRLLDASSIQYPNISPMQACTVSLAGYMILTSKSHHSWYNSHGFKSDNYEEEVKENTEFSHEPMIRLLRVTGVIRSELKKNPVRSIFRPLQSEDNEEFDWRSLENSTETDILVKELLDVYNGEVNPDTPIHVGIKRIHEMAMGATSCKDPKITLYKELMNAALRRCIKYTVRLIYTL